jgi:hypothetical protein
MKAKHSLMADVDFLASNLQTVSPVFKPLGTTWNLGKNIVGTSVDLAAELDGWGAVLERNGDIPLLRQKQAAVLVRIEAVVKDLQVSRKEIAGKLGMRPEDLIPPQARRGLGSDVAPL